MIDTVQDFYNHISVATPAGMNPTDEIPTFTGTPPRHDQGDLCLIKNGYYGIHADNHLGNLIENNFAVIKGEISRNDHEIVLGVNAEAYWNQYTGTDYEYDLGVLTVHRGEVYLYHTEEHRPHRFTPNSGRIIFRRQRSQLDEIAAVAD